MIACAKSETSAHVQNGARRQACAFLPVSSPCETAIAPQQIHNPPVIPSAWCALSLASCQLVAYRRAYLRRRVRAARCRENVARTCSRVTKTDGWTASSLKSIESRIKLSDGRTMPALGLGAAMPPSATSRAVRAALDLGYRLIDTAQNYRNELEVGQSVQQFMVASGVSRDQIFVSSKIDPDRRGFKAALAAGRESCATLGLGYIDRMILHTPWGGKLVETYDALLELQAEGTVRSIGVSNFDQVHLETLTYYERPNPVINQIEMHPLLWDERASLVAYCQARKIQVEAFCPLLRGATEFLENGTLPELAARMGRTPAQLLLRWSLQRGLTAIPKTTHPDRLATNMDVFDFDLPEDVLLELENMEGFRGQRTLLLYPEALTAPVDVGRVLARARHQLDAGK